MSSNAMEREAARVGTGQDLATHRREGCSAGAHVGQRPPTSMSTQKEDGRRRRRAPERGRRARAAGAVGVAGVAGDPPHRRGAAEAAPFGGERRGESTLSRSAVGRGVHNGVLRETTVVYLT